MSNVDNNADNAELHLFEKSAQALGVEPTASWEQVCDAFAEIENSSHLQQMARDVLLETHSITRRLILAAWHKPALPMPDDGLQKLLRDIPPSWQLSADEWKKERMKEQKTAFASALSTAREKQDVALFFVSSILGLRALRNGTRSKRVWFGMTDSIFMDLLKVCGLTDQDGFEEEEKVIGIEVEPYIHPCSVKYEIRFRTSGKRGGENDKTIHNGKTGWRRKPVFFSFQNKAWTDLILSTILRRYKDKELSALGMVDCYDQHRMDLLGAHIGALEKEDYPETILEIQRIVYLLADQGTLKKMKAAGRMRQWRANHPKSASNKEDRNAYMREYRAKQKDTLREKQKGYTQKWRGKQKQKG